jgi:hypothetical protein
MSNRYLWNFAGLATRDDRRRRYRGGEFPRRPGFSFLAAYAIVSVAQNKR